MCLSSTMTTKKRPTLAESMKVLSKTQEPPPGHSGQEQAPPAAKPASTRAGKRRLTFVVEPEEHRRIKHLSADTDRSIECLLHEALMDFLHKHNA